MLMFPTLFPTKSELMCACAHGYCAHKAESMHNSMLNWIEHRGLCTGVSSGRDVCSNMYMYVDASERKPETHCLKVRSHQGVF